MLSERRVLVPTFSMLKEPPSEEDTAREAELLMKDCRRMRRNEGTNRGAEAAASMTESIEVFLHCFLFLMPAEGGDEEEGTPAEVEAAEEGEGSAPWVRAWRTSRSP
jgi:hypothetical protein